MIDPTKKYSKNLEIGRGIRHQLLCSAILLGSRHGHVLTIPQTATKPQKVGLLLHRPYLID